MTIVKGSADCGNSPKNRFVQSLAVALVSGDVLPDALAETAVWNRSSGTAIEGRAAIEEWLGQQQKPSEIEVAHAISHGRVGAANGTLTLADGQLRRFSFVFEFTNTKANMVSRIESYE